MHRQLARGIGRLTDDLLIDRAQGTFVYDSRGSGRRLLDFTSGIGVTNTGHCHPKVVKAIQQQASQLLHQQINIAMHRPMIQLCDKLHQSVMPADQLDTFFFWNSGAEAVEAAVKLARHATGRPNLIAFTGGYHGRTVGTMSLTSSDTIYRAKFGPLMGGGVFFAEYPYPFHAPHEWSTSPATSVDDYCLQSVERVLRQQTAAEETAAVIIEPVLGEGGYVPASAQFMQGLRKLCDQYGLLLIADEVQTGFGRTGAWFACQHSGVVPDILVMAKGLASGMPLSCIASRRELMDKQPPGSMGGTYAGNSVACAAALATIKVIEDEELLENCRQRGDQMRQSLLAIQRRFPDRIGDVRGMGLMQAVEFLAPTDRGDKRAPILVFPHDSPCKGLARRVQQECLRRNMLLLKCSTFETLRFIPPLTVSENEMAEGMQIFAEAVESAVSSNQ